MPQDTTRAERVRQLFDELIDLAPGERAARLGAVDDAALRNEVEALLAGADEAPARLGSYERMVEDYRHAVLDGTDLMPEPGEIVSRYELLERIGAGGMGVVFRARDTRLHRLVALKFLPGSLRTRREARARFLREARAAALLDHPNICTVYEIDEAEDGHLFIAMALVEGETLKARLARGPLPVDEAAEVATRLASGLAYAHARGIIHRDVKPSNIIYTAGGSVKLLDFGIARMDDGDHTRTGTMLGTAAYMSPEQARGEEVDARSDVWALGVVLYELLTGTRPFHGDSELATVAAILHGTPRSVQQHRPDVPDALAAVVERALARAPVDRFATMGEMEDALRLAQQPKVAPAPAGQWRGWPAALAGLGIAVLLSLGLLWRSQADSAAASPHTLAVLYFDNLTGDARLDWVEAGMVEMLTANLAQFDGLDVLSSQRLFDLVKQTSGAGRRVDQSTATEIARRAGVQTMILGSVLGDDASVRLNAQFVEVATGELIGTEVLEMDADASLFALTDSLTQRIAARLAVVPRGRPHGARVAYTLTGSPDALQHYVAGVQALYRANYAEAQDHFTRAIDTDASFALAYYYRALAHAWETGDPGRPDLERALRYGDGLSRRERALVEATLTMSESLPTRKTAFERLVARYPDEKFARYQLGEIQYHNYWPRASVASFEAAVALDPHFLLAYLHPIDFYFHTDSYAAARPLVEAAYGLDSTNIELRLYRAALDYAMSDSLDGHVALIQRLQQVASDTSLTASARFHAHAAISFALYRYDALEQDYLRFREDGHYGDEGFVLATNSLAGLALVQGDLPGVEARLGEARARYPDSPTQLYEEGLYRLMRGHIGAAEALARRILALHDEGVQPFPEVATLGRHLLFQAQVAGRDEAGYIRSLAALQRQYEAGENEYGFLYRAAAGRLACAAGDVGEALGHFAAARERISFTGTAGGVALHFSKLLLEAELECLDRAGDYEAVVRRIEATSIWIHHYHDLNLSTMAAWLRSRLYLAHAYEGLGRTDDALRRYQNVLGFWDEAPEVLPEIQQARARYDRLAARTARVGS